MAVVNAYVDESARRGRYLMCSVVVDPTAAGPLRRRIRGLLLPGQRRLHFSKEGVRRRRQLADVLVNLDLDVTVVMCRAVEGRREVDARARCVTGIVRHLQRNGDVVSLVLESRHHQDIDDLPVIAAARTRTPALNYQHVDGNHDPLLWLPDSFAWLYGAGGDWKRRASQAINHVVDVT